MAKTELFRRTSGGPKRQTQRCREQRYCRNCSSTRFSRSVAADCCVNRRGTTPDAQQTPSGSTNGRFGRGTSASPDAPPKSTLPAPRRSCKWREGLIVASATRCPTLALATQRPHVHHRWPPRGERSESGRPPPTTGRGERSEPVDAHQEQKGGERSEPVMPRPSRLRAKAGCGCDLSLSRPKRFSVEPLRTRIPPVPPQRSAQYKPPRVPAQGRRFADFCNRQFGARARKLLASTSAKLDAPATVPATSPPQIKVARPKGHAKEGSAFSQRFAERMLNPWSSPTRR